MRVRNSEFGVRSWGGQERRRAETPHSALCTPHTLSLRTPHSALRTRRGISLLEVLISMFILTVGLLSISTLLPVGSFQVQKAGIEDRKSTIGQNAFREFRTRGMSDIRKWIHYFSPQGPEPVIAANGSVHAELSPQYLPLSVAIDPLCLGNGFTGGAISKLFPRLPAGVTNDDMRQPRMPRVGLLDVRNRQIAEQIFLSHDDAVFEETADPDSPPVSKWELDANNNPIRRQFEGNFSWLVTLTPAYFTSAMPAPTTQYNVSIAIFFKRSVNSRTTGEGVEVERMVEVDTRRNQLGGFGLGGGELVLKGNAANTAVRPGDWVLVSGRYPGGRLAKVPVFRWYRVVVAGEYEQDKTQRVITLAGPDWPGVTNEDPAKWTCLPSHVAIFEGCVGVFEKTVHLEGPSVWSN